MTANRAWLPCARRFPCQPSSAGSFGAAAGRPAGAAAGPRRAAARRAASPAAVAVVVGGSGPPAARAGPGRRAARPAGARRGSGRRPCGPARWLAASRGRARARKVQTGRANIFGGLRFSRSPKNPPAVRPLIGEPQKSRRVPTNCPPEREARGHPAAPVRSRGRAGGARCPRNKEGGLSARRRRRSRPAR